MTNGTSLYVIVPMFFDYECQFKSFKNKQHIASILPSNIRNPGAQRREPNQRLGCGLEVQPPAGESHTPLECLFLS